MTFAVCISSEAVCVQLVRAGLDAARVRHIFITHLHGDHCFGLPGVLQAISNARAGTPAAEAGPQPSCCSTLLQILIG